MTPQDKIELGQIDEPELELAPETDEFAVPPDDEPFELPTSNFEEAIALLRSWREDESDTEEQQETMEFLVRVLDEDRFTTRKLFP
jgi:hypothetical protein